MSLKRFNADVRSSRNRLNETSLPGIVSIERGDSDGELVANFMHEKLSDPVAIRLLAQNADGYPDENSFLLFTDAEDVPSIITETLKDLQNYTFGQNVFNSLRDLSTSLDRALNSTDTDADTRMDGADESHDDDEVYDDDTFNNFSEVDDETFGLSPEKAYAGQHVASKLAAEVLRKMKRDLRKARKFDAKVGILSGVKNGARTHVLSLSIRASRLGISDEALEAWDVERSDYIVLLIRVDEPYPSADRVSTQAVTHMHMDFRFGKCRKYKPTWDSARRAFDASSQHTAATNNTLHVTDSDDRAFKKLFISNSLEQFMNENFLSLFKLRLHGCSSWDEANTKLRDLSVRFQSETQAASKESSNEKDGSEKVKCKDFAAGPAQTSEESRTIPALLCADSFAESVEDISTPLVAMQFATHYFVRCTEYCLRCHRRLDKDFEALKPFVCPDPLCLFQYITMGFGPSIEHEIITQPYVVDLLVTLCYASIQNPSPPGLAPTPVSSIPVAHYRIRDFPTGLRLKVPLAAQTAEDAENSMSAIKVSVDLNHNLLVVKNIADLNRLSGGTWVVLQHAPHGPKGQVLSHQAHIKYVDRLTNSVEAEIVQRDPLFSSLSQPTGRIDMDLLVYDTEFDDVDNDRKARAMVTILNTLPPISHLREYLMRNPHSKLRSYPGISSPALTLLEWIVASNRSCILQVSSVEDGHAVDQALLGTIKTRDQEVIPDMGRSYIQFRFAQGTPDKELRFHRALNDLGAHGQKQHPTLFAWHGSDIRNWHSILRQGLDFKNIRNGRAFGNGVYFSPNFAISQGYMLAMGSWPNSALDAGGVIALCEIINAPEDFVSNTPHYVVQHVDWIQCRYLFVSRARVPSTNPNVVGPGVSAGTGALVACSTSTKTQGTGDQMVEIAQDPRRLVKGPNGVPLRIPVKALPSSRSALRDVKPTKISKILSKTKRSRNTMAMSTETDEEAASDLEVLFSDDEADQPPLKRTNSSASRKSSVDAVTARQVTTRRPMTPPMTDFRPGALDPNSLPRLALPQWADINSTKRLTSDIKQLQKTYTSTPLHELGWYMDFENIENMFQWIVELHSFDPELPLAKDMKQAGVSSVVLEVRFGRDYPFSPPFVRVIRPRFLPFLNGGGGHVTIGGALCMELLTTNGWTPATSMEAVFVSIKMAISSTDPRPARLNEISSSARGHNYDYSAAEALDAYERAARTHGWTVPKDIRDTASQGYT